MTLDQILMYASKVGIPSTKIFEFLARNGQPGPLPIAEIHLEREFGIRKGLKKLVISSKIRIFIGENQ